VRRRLLAAFVGMTILTILLFGVPRVFITAELARDAEAQDLDRVAAAIAGLVSEELLQGVQPSVQAIAAVLGSGEVARLTGGGIDTPLVVGAATLEVHEFMGRASGLQGLVVEIARSDDAVDARVRGAVLSLAMIGAGVTVISVALAFRLSTMLSRPFVDLADDAARLGDDHFEVGAGTSQIREAVAVRTALRESGRRLSGTIRREREFAANASHQLRTPLAGLRLRLEDLSMWPQVDETMREELTASISDVDRLAATITGLLELSRRGFYGPAETVDVGVLVVSAAERWVNAASAAGRQLRIGILDTAQVEVPVGAVDQVLDVLTHNALTHGVGTVTLEALTEDGHTRLRVRDEGTGVSTDEQRLLFKQRTRSPASGGISGEGIGLALARDVAISAGGRITVGIDAPTRFDLILPVTVS
jgi:signal transduction histidine kinase